MHKHIPALLLCLATACAFEPPGLCSRDNDCAAGLSCSGGLCTGCSSDSQCQSWQSCTSDRTCVAAAGMCATAAQCSSWELCGSNHVCALAPGHCSSNASCASWEVCSAAHDCAPQPYNLRLYAGPVVWTSLGKSAAVDSQDRLYVTNGTTVYRVENGTASIYLSASDLTAQVGNVIQIDDLDVASDDRLYLMISRFNGDGIYVSDVPGQIAPHFDLGTVPGFLFDMNMVSPDRALISVGYDGLYEADALGARRVYDNTLVGVSDCATPDLAAMPTGYFFYSPGCNGSVLRGGKTDGSGVGMLHQTADMNLGYWPNFEGFGRDPKGGIMLNGLWEVFHVDEGGALRNVVYLKTYAASLGDEDYFYDRGIAVGPTGRIYLVGGPAIHVAEPAF